MKSARNWKAWQVRWAQKYTTPITAYKAGFLNTVEFVEPFSTIDCRSLEISTPLIEKLDIEAMEPSVYGDNWSDVLEKEDLEKIKVYFRNKERVRNNFGFLNFRVGGTDNFLSLSGPKDKGITFEVPRHSLMTAIEYRIFDDLLIGNFMKTTLHNVSNLYEGVGNFTFNVAKYGDNGLVESEKDIKAYLAEYRRRSGTEFLYQMFLDNSKILFSRFVSRESKMFRLARGIYHKAL